MPLMKSISASVARARAAHGRGYKLVVLMQRRLIGLRYAARVLISGVIVWLILDQVAHMDPLWGLISAVVVTDLKVRSAMNNFVSRMLNTLIGCGIAVGFLKLFGASPWVVLLAMAFAIVVSADLFKEQVSWRVAPITAAIVMTPAYMLHNTQAAQAAALRRTAEVVIGAAVAVAVSYATAGLFRSRQATGQPVDDEV
jgi:uncharacterized membrane protein YccC